MGEEEKRVLRARGVVRYFGERQALAEVDFSVLPGEIHVLLGNRGAGKSTLFKCLSGAEKPGAGEIRFGEDEIPYGNPVACMRLGISAIYQYDDLSRDLTIAKSLFLGHEPKKFGLVVDSARMVRESVGLLDKIGCGDLDPETVIADLPLGKQRMVSFARAVARGAKVILVDEPPAPLDDESRAEIHQLMTRLAEEGIGIAYATSDSKEAERIGDRLTVIAGGRVIGHDIGTDTPLGDLEEMKSGHPVGELYPPRPTAVGGVVLQVRNLGRGKEVRDVSFDLRAGEVLGVGGIVGAGRTELLRLIYGLDEPDTGTVVAGGEEIPPLRPDRAIAAGIGLAPGEHRPQEQLPAWTLTKNVTLADLSRFMYYAMIESRSDPNAPDDRENTGEMRALEGRIGDPDRALAALSGSNRQKVALARWLLRHCRVLLLDEPSEKLPFDERARFYQVVVELARLGTGVIFVSSNMRELAGLCTRILVMRHGKVVAEVPGAGASEQELVAAATQNGDKL